MKPLRRYIVTGEVTISVHTEVEARSAKEARELADEHGVMSLCHSCSAESCDEQWVTSGELDGAVKIRDAELLDE